MVRLRNSLLLFAAAALLLAGAPTFGAVDAAQCPAPAQSLTVGTPTPLPAFMIPPQDDYILCTCDFCKANPYVDCQISPSGYSIQCSDWYRLHC